MGFIYYNVYPFVYYDILFGHKFYQKTTHKILEIVLQYTYVDILTLKKYQISNNCKQSCKVPMYITWFLQTLFQLRI